MGGRATSRARSGSWPGGESLGSTEALHSGNYMAAMAATLTANEEAQLLQTIEMFEVITRSQPLDFQSLEILKEAYFKLGFQKDVVTTSKRIAQAYVQLGQLSSAILEYESILQRFPEEIGRASCRERV